MPQPIQQDGADQWLFELLERLDYIQPIKLRSRSQGDLVRGLRHAPHPAVMPLIEAEIVV